MTLSKQQKQDAQPAWKTYLCLWERDLLYMAGKFENWLDIAVGLGFSVEKVLQPWPHSDAGRYLKIVTQEEYQQCWKEFEAEEKRTARARYEEWAKHFSIRHGLPYEGVLLMAGYVTR